tara:strand:+ start:507 stop:803 length:297 start_codon:yes stop_codon:yes gene_type:complete
MAITVTTRIENDVVDDIDTVAKQEAIDRSAVIRRFLIKSIKEWKIQKHLVEYEQGKTTLWQAAKQCELSLYEIIEEVKQRKIHVPYGIEEFKEDVKAL